jgi:hypothetical protein
LHLDGERVLGAKRSPADIGRPKQKLPSLFVLVQLHVIYPQVVISDGEHATQLLLCPHGRLNIPSSVPALGGLRAEAWRGDLIKQSFFFTDGRGRLLGVLNRLVVPTHIMQENRIIQQRPRWVVGIFIALLDANGLF